MHVLLLVPEYPPDAGGVATSAARLAEGLAARGHRLTVVTKASLPSAPLGHAVVTQTPCPGVALLRYPRGSFYPSHWARELGDLCERLRGGPPQIVHAMGSLRFGQIALAVGHRFAAPVVYGMRGSDVTVAALQAPGRLASVMRGASALTAVSRPLAERALRQAACAREVAVIPNAVRTAPAPARATLRQALGVPVGMPLVGARLTPRWVKGPEPLRRVVAHLAGCHDGPLGLCVFGAADDGALAEAWRAGGGEALRPFRHAGWLEPRRVADVLAALDLLVMTSRYEGMPNLLLESLAVGTPVAAMPAEGCRAVLEDSGAGVLLPWEEADAAAAIARLLASGTLGAMRAAARRQVEIHHRPEREVAAVAALYQSLAVGAVPARA